MMHIAWKAAFMLFLHLAQAPGGVENISLRSTVKSIKKRGSARIFLNFEFYIFQVNFGADFVACEAIQCLHGASGGIFDDL